MKKLSFILGLAFSLASTAPILFAEAGGQFIRPDGQTGDVQINNRNKFFADHDFTYSTNTKTLLVPRVDVISATVDALYFVDGSTQTTAGGGGGASELDDLTDVDTTGQAVDYVMTYNGSGWVPAPAGTSFIFSIATFSDSIASTVEIGTGVWKSTGTIIFTATYNNGPPIGSTVTFNVIPGGMAMTGSFLGPTVSTFSVTMPSVTGTRVFTLTAQKGAVTDTEVITHTFYNRRFWGVSTVASGFTEANVEALAGTELSNAVSKTFSVTPGATEYIVYAYPARLGTATFTVGGFEGGFSAPETVSITNGFGFTENFYVYKSVNLNLGATTVVAQ